MFKTLALGAVVAAACSGPGAQAGTGGKPGLLLNVNDPMGVGSVGDARLSLDEAIRIANGTLDPATLSAPERMQITRPANAGPIRINIALARNSEIHFASTVLSPITSSTPTVIEGNGAILVSPTSDHIPDDKPAPGMNFVLTTKRVAFRIFASGVTVRNFHMVDWAHGIEIRPPLPQGIDHITVDNNSFQGISSVGIEVIGTTPQGSISRIETLDISNNVLRGVPKGPASLISRAISINAGGHPTDMASQGSAIRGVTITHDAIEGFFSGIYVAGNAGGTGYGGQISGVTISDNTMSRCGDTCVTMFTMSPATKSMTEANAHVSNVEISRNRMVSGFSAGVFLWASETFLGAHVVGGEMDHVRIIDNQVFGDDDHRCLFGGVGLWGAFSENSGKEGLVDGGSVHDLSIDRNHVFHCTVGVGVVASGTHTYDSLEMRKFTVSDVKIRDNELGSDDTAIYLGGALVRNVNPRPMTLTSVLSGNDLHKVMVSDNHISGSAIGLEIHGAESRDVTSASLINNTVSDVTITANDIRTTKMACLVNDQVSARGEPLTLKGNRAIVTCPPD